VILRGERVSIGKMQEVGVVYTFKRADVPQIFANALASFDSVSKAGEYLKPCMFIEES